MAVSDICALVVNPDSLCFTELHSPNFEHHTKLHIHDEQWLILNRYCPSIDLERDITSLIKTDFQSSLLPVTIHRDESLREAFAFKQPVIDCAPTQPVVPGFRSDGGMVDRQASQNPAIP